MSSLGCVQNSNDHDHNEDSLIAGGDDVQQLCEAGEEEFLEIMMLVDMASKPLHVRRLQKALQEWVQNPGKKNSLFCQKYFGPNNRQLR